MGKENKSQGTTDYKTVFGITAINHCEKKDKPIIVFKHVKRSYRALDLTIHGELGVRPSLNWLCVQYY